MRRLALLFVAAAAAPFACGPDPKPPEPCDGPDFTVLITAKGGELPSDTRVVLVYGSGHEEFRLDLPATPEVLFCTAVDEQGQPLEAGAAAGSSGGAANAGAAGSDGHGGGASSAGAQAKGSGVDALRCSLWTQGPATLEIKASGFPEVLEELKLENGTCTVEAEIQLEHDADQDAGR